MFRNAAIAFLALSLPATAQAPADLISGQVRSGWRTDQGTHMAALHLDLAPDWKTYWRAPGDAGIPPHFIWTGSENVQSVRFHWPTPSVFDQNGMRSIGYHDRLVLPMEVTPQDASRPILLRGQVDLGICHDICVPVSLTISADLPPKGAPDPVISGALADQPVTARPTSLRCDVAPIRDGLRLTARMERAPGDEVAVFELPESSVWISEATVAQTGGQFTATADIVPNEEGFALNRSDLRITLIGPDGAVDMRGCPAD